ncbi:hypothetical protein I553_1713, partial [Mycobacterium xenopi 4042]
MVGPESAGTFAGFGSSCRCGSRRMPPSAGALPLCALITAWAREQAQPHARASPRLRRRPPRRRRNGPGRRLRTEIDQLVEPTGVLIVADGANTLTRRPRRLPPGRRRRATRLDDALACGDTAALTR